MTSSPIRLMEKGLKRYGGVVIFFLLTLFLFEQGMAHFRNERITLEKRLAHLESERLQALKIQEDLKEQIAHHEEKGWIELTLMRVLGVIPDGQRKVIIK